MKKVIRFLMMFCMTIGVQAGDPGSFAIDFYDAGVPPWLEKDKILGGLTSKKVWVGITSHSKEEGRLVRQVFSDSPAKKAGIRIGDIIEKESWDSLFKGTQANEFKNLIIFRDKKKMTLKVRLGLRDPLVDSLINIEGDGHHSGDEHRGLHSLSVKNKKYMYENMFLNNKAFDCKNAHKKLSIKMLPSSSFTAGGAQVVVIRGSHRVMFINKGRYTKVGANTICVNSADYDGKNLTKEKVTKLYWKLFGNQIDYWYENP